MRHVLFTTAALAALLAFSTSAGAANHYGFGPSAYYPAPGVGRGCYIYYYYYYKGPASKGPTTPFYPFGANLPESRRQASWHYYSYRGPHPPPFQKAAYPQGARYYVGASGR